MTYNVFGVMLNLTQSATRNLSYDVQFYDVSLSQLPAFHIETLQLFSLEVGKLLINEIRSTTIIVITVFCAVQKDNDYQPYDMEQVRHIAWQLCKAVKCMQLLYLVAFSASFLRYSCTRIAQKVAFSGNGRGTISRLVHLNNIVKKIIILATILYKQYLSHECICTADLFDTRHTVMLRCTDKDSDFELNRD